MTETGQVDVAGRTERMEATLLAAKVATELLRQIGVEVAVGTMVEALAPAFDRIRTLQSERDEAEARVCDECPDGLGWKYNAVEGRHPCVCLTETEAWQELEAELDEARRMYAESERDFVATARKLERKDAALREARARERATLEALGKVGTAHANDDYAEAYHLLYWLLVDHYGMDHKPYGPFASARRALAPEPDWKEQEAEREEANRRLSQEHFGTEETSPPRESG